MPEVWCSTWLIPVENNPSDQQPIHSLCFLAAQIPSVPLLSECDPTVRQINSCQACPSGQVQAITLKRSQN